MWVQYEKEFFSFSCTCTKYSFTRVVHIASHHDGTTSLLEMFQNLVEDVGQVLAGPAVEDPAGEAPAVERPVEIVPSSGGEVKRRLAEAAARGQINAY